MRNSLDGELPDKETRSKIIGHVGYVILDNMSFAESPLGEEIVTLINDYAELD